MRPGTSKTVVSLLGTGVTNGETVTANIDTLGFDYCEIDVVMGVSNTTSNNPSTLKLSESDITDATGFSNVSGTVGDTDWTIPSASTSIANVYRFNVDCRYRKRYLKVTATPVTTQETVMVAHLGGGSWSGETPDSATEAGVAAVVSV